MQTVPARVLFRYVSITFEHLTQSHPFSYNQSSDDSPDCEVRSQVGRTGSSLVDAIASLTGRARRAATTALAATCFN